jgi:hypothetical protein
MRIRGGAPDGLVLELGLRPGASPLARYLSGDIEVPRIEASPLACPRRAACPPLGAGCRGAGKGAKAVVIPDKRARSCTEPTSFSTRETRR